MNAPDDTVSIPCVCGWMRPVDAAADGSLRVAPHARPYLRYEARDNAPCEGIASGVRARVRLHKAWCAQEAADYRAGEQHDYRVAKAAQYDAEAAACERLLRRTAPVRKAEVSP